MILLAWVVRQLKSIIKKFGFTSKILCYAKNKGTNLGSTTTTLKTIISCESLNLHVLFNGSCFGHAMSKTSQYATNDDNISKDLGSLKMWNLHKHPFKLASHGQKQLYVCWSFWFFVMWEFVGCQKLNKFDLIFSLSIVDQGVKEWRQACWDSSLF